MRALRLFPLLVLAACAHSKAQPIVITGHMLDAGGMTFEAVSAGMKSANDAGVLTVEQVRLWNDFLARWKVAYPLAAKTWREARAKLDQSAAEQAAGILTGLLGELASFQLVVAGAKS